MLTPSFTKAHGTSGIFDESAPSNNKFLWHNFQLPFQLALNGYVVVATDYAGLGIGIDGHGKPVVHEYLNGPAQANDIFFSVIAARQAFPTLSKDFVTLGMSQGGMAVWTFAQKLVEEPLPGYLGTVVLHPVTRILDLPLDSPTMPFILTMLMPSLVEVYPCLMPQDIFTPKGIDNLKTLEGLKGSTTLLFALPAGLDNLQAQWHRHSAIRAYNESSASGRRAFVGPLLVLQGADDPVDPNEPTTAAIHDTAKLFPSGECLLVSMLVEVDFGACPHH